MATNAFPTNFSLVSMYTWFDPCLLSELSFKSLLFISCTKFCCHLLKKNPIKTRSFARNFCSD